jgi:hypothetical protein
MFHFKIKDMYFTEEEKNWLKTIVQAHQSKNWKNIRLNNLFESIFNRIINTKELFPHFSLKDGESNDPNNGKEYAEAVQKGYFPIAKFVYMLIFLNKEHLILLIPEFQIDCANNITIEGCEPQNEEEEEDSGKPFSLDDNTIIVNFLKENLEKFVVPTGNLIHLVENKFVSDEEKRFRKQQRCTVAGLIIAFITGIGSLLINIFCK